MEMTADMKAVLWTLGRITALIDAGLVRGPVCTAPKGTAVYDQLVAGGYRASESEVRGVLAALVPAGLIRGVPTGPDLDVFVTLITQYEDPVDASRS